VRYEDGIYHAFDVSSKQNENLHGKKISGKKIEIEPYKNIPQRPDSRTRKNVNKSLEKIDTDGLNIEALHSLIYTTSRNQDKRQEMSGAYEDFLREFNREWQRMLSLHPNLEIDVKGFKEIISKIWNENLILSAMEQPPRKTKKEQQPTVDAAKWGYEYDETYNTALVSFIKHVDIPLKLNLKYCRVATLDRFIELYAQEILQQFTGNDFTNFYDKHLRPLIEKMPEPLKRIILQELEAFYFRKLEDRSVEVNILSEIIDKVLSLVAKLDVPQQERYKHSGRIIEYARQQCQTAYDSYLSDKKSSDRQKVATGVQNNIKLVGNVNDAYDLLNTYIIKSLEYDDKHNNDLLSMFKKKRWPTSEFRNRASGLKNQLLYGIAKRDILFRIRQELAYIAHVLTLIPQKIRNQNNEDFKEIIKDINLINNRFSKGDIYAALNLVLTKLENLDKPKINKDLKVYINLARKNLDILSKHHEIKSNLDKIRSSEAKNSVKKISAKSDSHNMHILYELGVKDHQKISFDKKLYQKFRNQNLTEWYNRIKKALNENSIYFTKKNLARYTKIGVIRLFVFKLGTYLQLMAADYRPIELNYSPMKRSPSAIAGFFGMRGKTPLYSPEICRAAHNLLYFTDVNHARKSIEELLGVDDVKKDLSSLLGLLDQIDNPVEANQQKTLGSSY
jgi:hypothetical protein